jgi:transcriptional regulator of acetoin/glycerol metabolism
MVADGRFRQDLYYRISAFPIHLPPLRERAADIPMLVDSFLQRGGNAKHRVAVEPEAMVRLQAHDWPGNIRELRNVLDRARLFADDGIVRAEHMPDEFGYGSATRLAVLPTAPPVRGRASTSDEQLAEIVATFQGTRRELAAQLGISERTLYRRLKALGLA